MSASPVRTETEQYATSVLMHDANHDLALRPIHFRDRLLARLCAGNLDTQLAAGAPIESRKLRAVRAALLVTPAQRERLASAWVSVLHQAEPIADPIPMVASSRVPVQHDEVREAAPQIEELTTVLRSPRPISARGAAMARVLLIDGGGPLYSAGCRRNLADSVAEAARELDSLCL